MSNKIRNAVLLAADHVEQFPSEFNFFSFEIPLKKHCGTPGCALGWIAHFLGYQGEDWTNLVGVSDSEFYERMDALEGHDSETAGRWGDWSRSADKCAAALRRYADKHLPETK